MAVNVPAKITVPENLDMSDPAEIEKIWAQVQDMIRHINLIIDALDNTPVFHNGASLPSTSLGKTGDFYLDVKNSDFYFRNSLDDWQLLVNLKYPGISTVDSTSLTQSLDMSSKNITLPQMIKIAGKTVDLTELNYYKE